MRKILKLKIEELKQKKKIKNKSGLKKRNDEIEEKNKII